MAKITGSIPHGQPILNSAPLILASWIEVFTKWHKKKFFLVDTRYQVPVDNVYVMHKYFK